MTKKKFEKVYQKEKCLWGLQPDKYIKEILRYKKLGEVLDIGTGEGRNALYLAKHGFKVTGIDISSTAMKRFKKLAKKLNIKIKGAVLDMTKLKFKKKYDIIISISTLHFLEKKEINKLIKRIKEHTKKEGLNIIKVFTEENPLKNFRYLFKKGELRECYNSWRIISYKEFITPLEKHGKNGKLHRHALAVIIAQKF